MREKVTWEWVVGGQKVQEENSSQKKPKKGKKSDFLWLHQESFLVFPWWANIVGDFLMSVEEGKKN